MTCSKTNLILSEGLVTKWYEQWIFFGYVLGYCGEKKYPLVEVNLLSSPRVELDIEVVEEDPLLRPDE